MNYEFRKELLTIHKTGIRNFERVAGEQEIIFPEVVGILVPSDCSIVLKTAVEDFMDYLWMSMGVSAYMTNMAEHAFITITLVNNEGKVCNPSQNFKKNLENANGYRGFLLDVTCKEIFLYGYDERGAAQGLYYMEELMSHAKAPVLPIGEVRRKPLYSPQMVHSGYGLDMYPDDYLARIAHEGRDAILIFVKGINQTPSGHLDFNDLIYRAAKYGIDVYAYSYMTVYMHPEEEGAEAHYESVYGKLFEACPGLKGVTLVGESVGFPSHDPHVTPDFRTDVDADGLPLGKPRAGWYPCEDYPLWLNLVKKVIRKYNVHADIVFWTYNWGRLGEAERVALIENLPTDISLMATFEMFEGYRLEGIRDFIADYSLKFEGPGQYFRSEAKAAKKRGIRMYAMVNTGGLTWDFGLIPYEPMPQQWMRRYAGMKKAHDQWGLCGIMESHHFGFYPSFISRLSKWVFSDPDTPMEQHLRDILAGEYGGTVKETDKIIEALNLFSEAIRFYTPTDNDQYGAFRIGPAFPFSFLVPYKNPSMPGAHFGNRIYHAYYTTWYSHEVIFDKGAPVSVRLLAELRSLEKMLSHLQKGVQILESISSLQKELGSLINLGKYLCHCVITGIHAKKWSRLIGHFHAAESNEAVLKILDEMEALLHAEYLNAEDTIPLVRTDSRLGWEPSMEYMGNEERIRWKLKHTEYVIHTEIAAQRAAASKSNDILNSSFV